jgi:triosephosphate isomerase
MRQPLVAGNWKMNGSRASVAELLGGLKAGIGQVTTAEVAVCAPAIYLPDTQVALTGTPIKWGGQDVSAHASGAYTGEIAGSMLNDFGCHYVIIGHSERRAYHAETDETVAQKFAAARAFGLVPILCVGETLEQRDAGTTEQIIEEQLKAVIALAGVDSLSKAIIAYEPIWAIGTGKTASPQQAQDVHEFIRKGIAAQNAGVAENLTIQYGGSVKANNAAELFAMPDIDGGLIGGASLIASDFVAICHALQN